MQYELQKFVDHGISSTINLPEWGSELNNESRVEEFSKMVAKYAHGLRGLTFYPSGSRGGQPITSVPYEEAHSKRGVVYEDNSESQCLTGLCGI
jgi:ribonucleoside-diphosphate reductase alpha chain